jgi:hypothetical protein
MFVEGDDCLAALLCVWEKSQMVIGQMAGYATVSVERGGYEKYLHHQ